MPLTGPRSSPVEPAHVRLASRRGREDAAPGAHGRPAAQPRGPAREASAEAAARATSSLCETLGGEAVSPEPGGRVVSSSVVIENSSSRRSVPHRAAGEGHGRAPATAASAGRTGPGHRAFRFRKRDSSTVAEGVEVSCPVPSAKVRGGSFSYSLKNLCSRMAT